MSSIWEEILVVLCQLLIFINPTRMRLIQRTCDFHSRLSMPWQIRQAVSIAQRVSLLYGICENIYCQFKLVVFFYHFFFYRNMMFCRKVSLVEKSRWQAVQNFKLDFFYMNTLSTKRCKQFIQTLFYVQSGAQVLFMCLGAIYVLRYLNLQLGLRCCFFVPVSVYYFSFFYLY